VFTNTPRRLFIISSVLAALATNSFAGEHKAALTFGIVPQQSAAKLAATWGPLLAAISDKAGVRLEFSTAPDIPTFEQRMGKGEYDIAYMNPYHYTVFSERSGYRAFAKEKDRNIEGIIVVRADSPIKSIEELDGATLAFPAPAAFAASVLPRAALRQKGIKFTPKYVSSHDSVYFSVADGLYPAGGGIVRTLEKVSEQTRSSLRILWRTKQYTPHAFAARPSATDDALRRILAAMTEIGSTEQGRGLLAAVGFKGIEAAKDSDWDDVRQLGITALDSKGE
jgi:phosphonate transport system substrate-binding protein